jgi:hypothetical protein
MFKGQRHRSSLKGYVHIAVKRSYSISIHIWKSARCGDPVSFAPLGLVGNRHFPTAYAVGCILSPLRGCFDDCSPSPISLEKREMWSPAYRVFLTM